MATHSSIPAWRIPWTEEPGGLQSTGLKESDTAERLAQHGVTQQRGQDAGHISLLPKPHALASAQGS